jgi:3-oxoacyl-[acyl-carrier protein] reductase
LRGRWRAGARGWRCRGRTRRSCAAFRDELDEAGHHLHAPRDEHVAITCDLSKADDVEKLVPAAVDSLGKLDILVNNAGITRDNLAMRMKDEEWDAVIRVNLEAAFRLMRAAAKPMMKARFGRIVTITSVVGATGNPGQVNYAAAKGGLTAMTKSLAQELASRGVTANCVAPGFIRTAMTDALPDAQKEALNARIPMGRMGEGPDIGAAVAFLASSRGGVRHRSDAARQRRHGDAVLTQRRSARRLIHSLARPRGTAPLREGPAALRKSKPGRARALL